MNPAALQQRLRAIAELLGLQPSARQLSQLAAHVELLRRWNAIYNLTAVRDLDAVLSHHVADCLATIAPIQRVGCSGAVLDVGSGGGLPGVIIAVMLPALQITCLDAVAKKAAFLRQVSATLQLGNLSSLHGRVEALVPQDRYSLISSRAFSSLAQLTTMTQTLLANGGVWMAMKGRVPEDEIKALSSHIEVFHVEHLVVPGLSARRCLVWMRPKSDEKHTP